VGFLYAVDDVEQIVERGAVGIEHDDHSTHNGVHLRPVDTLHVLQDVLQMPGDVLVARPMYGTDLDVGPAIAYPDTALATARVQSLQDTADCLPRRARHAPRDRADAARGVAKSHRVGLPKRHASSGVGGM
jgi:hypothetical protein